MPELETHDAEGAALAQWFAGAVRRFGTERPAAARRGRWCSADALVQFGSVPLILRIRDGTVEEIVASPPRLCRWDFAIRAPAAAWRKFWEPVPAPGWHDLLALYKRGELEIEGDLHPFMANLQFIKDLMSAGREAGRP